MKLTDYLGDKPFWRVTARLALPVALQNVLTSSFQLVDTMMVSRLGDVTLSAVGMAAQWGWLCNLLNFGLCSGMSVFISQYWGVKDHKGIRRVMGLGLVFSLFVSLLFLAVALAAPAWVVGLFNQDPGVLDAGCRYLRIVCFSYPAVALTYLLSNVLRGTERVRLPLYVSIVTTIANAFADYGLIFGAFGLPELGVQGAAIATCASYFVVFVIRAVDARKFIPFRFYVVGVTENCILLTVQTLFIVLQLPGWKLAQGVCIALLLLLNRKPLMDGAGKIVHFRR